MRIVFMGTPDFAVETLRALAEAGHEIPGVVTQPDKPRGRGKSLMPTPVKQEALRLGLPVYQPARVRDREFMELLEQWKPDAVVVAAFGQLLTKEILQLPRFGCLNVHASLLPSYRGAAPIQWAVINGEKESGVSIMRMDEGLDTGDVVSRAVVPLDAEETGGSLFDKLSRVGAQLLTETLPDIEAGTARYEKQPQESPTPYARMLTKQMGLVDWSRDAEELACLVRGLNPWPGAYTYLNSKTLKLWGAEPADSAELEPGTVVSAGRDGLTVACGRGSLRITRLQLEGKKQMDADAFLRGYPLKAGARMKRSRE